MKNISLLSVLSLVLFISSCTDETKKFIGKHTINIPLLIRNYDFSKKVMVGGELTNPEVHYIELFTSNLEFYRTDDGKLSGQLKYIHPESDQYKIYAHEITLSEENFELKNMRVENDTLIFVVSAGPMQSVLFDGWSCIQGDKTIIGLSKKLFPFLHSRHCTENIMREQGDYLYFIADQPADKKTLYQCQVDSLTKYLNVNPKFIPKWEADIEYLSKAIH